MSEDEKTGGRESAPGLPSSRLLVLYRAAVGAADPYTHTRTAVTGALSSGDDERGDRAWIVALGKASARMADAALDAARELGVEIAGGLVVGPAPHEVDPPLEHVVGDHPVPAHGSQLAADRLGALTHAVLPHDVVLVLISGGTSSLVGAPADGLDHGPFVARWRELLGSGLDIHAMNRERRALLRWGGGRLAEALAPARVHLVLLSDVIGDDPAIIGSGPCTPDPGAPPFAHVAPPVVIGRATLHEGIVRTALAEGITLHLHEEPLSGEARDRGDELAHWLAGDAHAGVHCWTGETTVTLGATPAGRGGRCQELALSAALALEQVGADGAGVTILAAGTDGRDGPTDAAGAIVDAQTAARIRSGGADPVAALRAHDAGTALERADALLVTGHTGTNVADVLLADVGERPRAHVAKRPR